MHKNNALTLRLGIASGSKSKSFPDDKIQSKLFSVTLMPGYRYTWHPSEVLSIYAGANIGMGRLQADVKYSGYGYVFKESGHGTGLAYSAEIGLQCALSETISLLAAYQYSGNTASFKLSDQSGPYDEISKTRKQTFNTFRVGIEIRF